MTAYRALLLGALVLVAGCDSKKAGPIPKEVPPPPPPKCSSDVWTTYGHDAQRTGTSLGCCEGPLTPAWSYQPEGADMREAYAEHVIVGSAGLYTTLMLGQSPAVDKLTPQGKQVWRFDSRVDIYRAEWPTLAHGVVFQNDDGFYLVDEATGKPIKRHFLDSWGQTLADATRFYGVNRWHIEGPPVFVGAMNRQGDEIWRQNKAGVEREDMRDIIGGIALDGGVVFQAARFLYNPEFPKSGVYAFDAKDGKPRWSHPTKPRTQLAAGDGRIYLAEEGSEGTLLRARSQKTGEVQWSTPVKLRRRAAPVLAGGNVHVVTGDGKLIAVNAASGKLSWSVELAKPPVKPVRPPRWSTTLAAAAGSQTLLVTEGDELVVRRLADGGQQWRGRVGDAAELHSPVIAGGRAYVSAKGTIHALSCAP